MLLRKLKDKVKLTGRERIRTIRNHNQWSRNYHQTQVSKSNIVKMNVDERMEIKKLNKNLLKNENDKKVFEEMFDGTHGHPTVIDVDRTNIIKVDVYDSKSNKLGKTSCYRVRGTNITDSPNLINIKNQGKTYTPILVGQNNNGNNVYVSGFTFTYVLPVSELKNQKNYVYLLHPDLDLQDNKDLVNDIIKTLNDPNNNIINYDAKNGELIIDNNFQWSDYEPLIEINK